MSGEGEAPERPRLQTASHGSVIATRDPKAVLRSGLVSGLGGWLLPTAAPSRGRSQWPDAAAKPRSEEHTSELQSLMRISYAVFCFKKKQTKTSLLQQQ